METLANPRMLLVFPCYVQRMGRWAVCRLSGARLFFSCSSLSLSAGSRPRGKALAGRPTHLVHCQRPRVRSGNIHDFSCFSHPITHCATFTYLGQGWMKGLLNKWGRRGREREDGRGGRGHAELHIYQHGLILSSCLCLPLTRRAWSEDLEEETGKHSPTATLLS